MPCSDRHRVVGLVRDDADVARRDQRVGIRRVAPDAHFRADAGIHRHGLDLVGIAVHAVSAGRQHAPPGAAVALVVGQDRPDGQRLADPRGDHADLARLDHDVGDEDAFVLQRRVEVAARPGHVSEDADPRRPAVLVEFDQRALRCLIDLAQHGERERPLVAEEQALAGGNLDAADPHCQMPT